MSNKRTIFTRPDGYVEVLVPDDTQGGENYGKTIIFDETNAPKPEYCSWFKYYSDGTFEAHYAFSNSEANDFIVQLPIQVLASLQTSTYGEVATHITRSSGPSTTATGSWWIRGNIVSGDFITGVRTYSTISSGFIVSVIGKWR
ncbi:MAG: hypothetical protein LBG88_04485 [Christensenellaceae bacterium]|nr:hypothetical protein [Christensenellaceae bacterium]